MTATTAQITYLTNLQDKKRHLLGAGFDLPDTPAPTDASRYQAEFATGLRSLDMDEDYLTRTYGDMLPLIRELAEPVLAAADADQKLAFRAAKAAYATRRHEARKAKLGQVRAAITTDPAALTQEQASSLIDLLKNY